MAGGKKNIVWLASYPKSGNTWFRVFLSNLLANSDIPVSINNLYPTPIASSRDRFDELVGVEAAEFTHDEVDLLRPKVYLLEAEDSTALLFKKVHDAYRVLPDGQPMFPANVSKGVVYFVRNPLDVIVSFAHHNVQAYEKTVAHMTDSRFGLCRTETKLANQLRQQLLTWQQHVLSWIDQCEIPVHLVRYEDMVSETFRTFANVLSFIGLSYSDEAVRKAIAFSSMEELRKQETKEGFKEKTPKSERFFRKGEKDAWQKELKPEWVLKLINDAFPLMKRLGYANQDVLNYVKQ